MKKQYILITIFVALGIILAACGGGSQGDGTLLTEVKNRGYLVVSSDANYEPQSFLDPTASRAEGTVCPNDMLTYGEMIGFDIDTAKGVADALGVEVCFVTPDWDVITAGHWSDRWDLSIGSMTITKVRQENLDFAHPYYFTPAQFAAAADSGITSWDDLNGQTICIATATTYLDWMNGDLGIPDSAIYTDPPSNVSIVELPTDQECAQSIAAGRPEFSIYLTSDTVINSNIENGLPVVKVGGVVFTEQLAPAIDKNSSFDTATFVTAVSDAIDGMHADGTLSQLSLDWFGVDLTQDPTK